MNSSRNNFAQEQESNTSQERNTSMVVELFDDVENSLNRDTSPKTFPNIIIPERLSANN